MSVISVTSLERQSSKPWIRLICDGRRSTTEDEFASLLTSRDSCVVEIERWHEINVFTVQMIFSRFCRVFTVSPPDFLDLFFRPSEISTFGFLPVGF